MVSPSRFVAEQRFMHMSIATGNEVLDRMVNPVEKVRQRLVRDRTTKTAAKIVPNNPPMYPPR